MANSQVFQDWKERSTILPSYSRSDGYRIRPKTGVAADRIERIPSSSEPGERNRIWAQPKWGKLMRRAIDLLAAEVQDDTLVLPNGEAFVQNQEPGQYSVRDDRRRHSRLQTDEEKTSCGVRFRPRRHHYKQVLRK